MRRNIPTSLPRLVGLLVLFSITPAGGAALLSATAGGGQQVVVLPGQSFSIAVALDAPDGMVHNSSLFSLVFTQPGLIYEGYTWAAPYENETLFDFSSPLWNALPLPIEPSLNPGLASAVQLSNVVPSGTFGSGVLVTLNLRVPSDWNEATTIGIVPVPDTFANGFEVVPVGVGEGVFVLVVPGAGAGGVMFTAALLLCSRRRRWSHRASPIEMSRHRAMPGHRSINLPA